MKERWIQVKPDADKKQEAWLNGWVSGKGIQFQSHEAEAQYRETAQMIVDAVQLQKTPKRVPISPSVGYFPIEYAGISYHDMMYNQEILLKACKKYCDDFKPDTFGGPLPMAGRVFDLLDFQMYHWPGHGLPKDREFQFVEKEYMTVDEYQDLIDDPTAWFMGVYFMVMPFVIPFGMQDVQDSLKTLMEAGEEAVAWLKGIRKFSLSIIGQGYPAVGGGLIKAPFDVIGDSLRGTKGIMIDLFRCPDKIKEACERLAPIMVKSGIASARASGSPFIMIPLHKGADGFMSEEQFLTLYWPTLRQILIGLIDEGLVTIPFAEGSYNSRLEIISDLPKGKTIWIFDRTDMARAKETIGKVACLQGNVPLSLMCAGTPDEVRAYCKNVIETAGEGGGYILSTGAGLQGAKAENLKAFIDAGRDFGVYN